MTDSVCCVCGGEDWVRAKPGDAEAGTETQRWCIPCDPTVAEFVTTRADALGRRIIFYHTGKACRNGHVSPRYASGGECRACMADRIAKQRKSGRRSEIDNAYHRRNKAVRNQTSRDWHAAKKAAMSEVNP